MTSKEAIEELKFQVGNITYFTHDSEGILRMSTYKVRDSGLFEIIEKDLERKEYLEYAIRDLFASHIEFVTEEDKCYLKIRNSKGKEKSFTSKTLEDFWKEVFGK